MYVSEEGVGGARALPRWPIKAEGWAAWLSPPVAFFCVSFRSPEPELNKSRRQRGLLEFAETERKGRVFCLLCCCWGGGRALAFARRRGEEKRKKANQPTPFEIALAVAGGGWGKVCLATLLRPCLPQINAYLQKD